MGQKNCEALAGDLGGAIRGFKNAVKDEENGQKIESSNAEKSTDEQVSKESESTKKES